VNEARAVKAIQPTIRLHTNGQVQALCRARSGRVTEVWSADSGRTWSVMAATRLPNPNSGIDAVTLRDGRHLLVYNRARFHRSPLNVAVSADGRVWKDVLVLESASGEYSYPAVIQSADGKVHITYTYRRESIKHVTLDPTRF
jgi:predicted neuraminidase